MRKKERLNNDLPSETTSLEQVMQENICLLPQEIYVQHLNSINGVKLSKREVDVIACMLSGRTAKETARLLSVSQKTVETHIYNVKKKLECSSLISIIEEANNHFILQKYYLSLLTYVNFEQCLKDIAKLKTGEITTCLILYWKENTNHSFLDQLKAHLELVGIKPLFKKIEHEALLTSFPSEHFVLYLISKEWINSNGRAQVLIQIKERVREFSTSTYVLFLDVESERQFLPDEYGNSSLSFANTQSYYFSFFALLKKLLPQCDFDIITKKFSEKYESIAKPVIIKKSENSDSTKLINFNYRGGILRQKKWPHLTSLIAIISVLCLTFFIFKKENYENGSEQTEALQRFVARSDSIVPNILLERPHLLIQIEDRFKEQKTGIQTVALVGIGGAGKTTLAREYAHQQKENVVWEINAETKENLRGSFEKLAYALSQTEEDRKILQEMEEIKDSIKREERIIEFVKNHLTFQSDWFLIYDNVEKFTDIQKYFPQDWHTWGKGKIIITTRDSNIANNSQVNHIILLKELNSTQKLNLFTKIMTHGISQSFTPAQLEEVRQFLEKIPPFPLDVSMAAYYLKSTNISYQKYLENLENYNPEFVNVQENLLQEAGTYFKTRYCIITLSLEHLIKAHKDFTPLLLFISLLDSQNIPRDLLDSYKNNEVVDNFVYYLKKYSLITHNSYEAGAQPTLSIHRSTQAIILSHLVKTLKLQESKTKFLMYEIVDALEKYVEHALDKESLEQGKQMISHLEMFLRHDYLLTDLNKGYIESELGRIYSSLSLMIKANNFFEAALLKLRKNENQHNQKIAQNLLFQGYANLMLGDFTKAENALGESIHRYEKCRPNNVSRLALALMYFGHLYKFMGKYTKAKQFLDQSLLLYEKLPSQNCAGKVMALTYLGHTYNRLGKYKEGQVIAEKGLAFCRKHLLSNSVRLAWPLIILGEMHNELGNYRKAINLSNQAIKIYEKNFSNNSVFIASSVSTKANAYCNLGYYKYALGLSQKALEILEKASKSDFHSCRMNTLMALGNAYKGLKDYKRAKYFLEKNLIISEKYFTKNHIDTAQALESLGQVYLLEGNLKTAKEFFINALNIFQKNDHPSEYKCLEDLSDLYLKKTSEYNREKARTYLEQARNIVKAHFPEASSHLKRIEQKLKILGQS